MTTCLHPTAASARLGDRVDGIGETTFPGPQRISAKVEDGTLVRFSLIDLESGELRSMSAPREAELGLTPPF